MNKDFYAIVNSRSKKQGAEVIANFNFYPSFLMIFRDRITAEANLNPHEIVRKVRINIIE